MNLITIMYQLIAMCYRMIMISYLYHRLYDHLHSQNIKKMLMSVHICVHIGSYDPIIVKPTSVVLNMLQEIQLYIISHINHDNSNINTCICTIQSHIDNIHLNKIQSAKHSSITKYF